MAVYSLDDRIPQLPDEGRYWAADCSIIVGDVILGDDVSVWFGSVLRGDNELIKIGSRTNIQDHCILHTDMEFPLEIGEGCTIGHRAIVHGCSIGDNTLIGMGATVLNGAKVGKNCLIGANALIPERKEIPDNSLVIGVPAKVVRELGAGAVQALRESADEYVKNWQRFASGLKKL